LVEGVDDGGVELDTPESPDLRSGIVDRPRVLVGASVGEGVEHIGERDDAGRERNPLAFQSVRVAVPVPPFVVAERDLFRELENRVCAVREDATLRRRCVL
jgi:hypothetical protein